MNPIGNQRGPSAPLNMSIPNDCRVAVDILTRMLTRYRDAATWNDRVSTRIFSVIEDSQRQREGGLLARVEGFSRKILTNICVTYVNLDNSPSPLRDPVLVGPFSRLTANGLIEDVVDRVMMNEGDARRFETLYNKFFEGREVLPLTIRRHEFADDIIRLGRSLQFPSGFILEEEPVEDGLSVYASSDLEDSDLVEMLFGTYSDLIMGALDREQTAEQEERNERTVHVFGQVAVTIEERAAQREAFVAERAHAHVAHIEQIRVQTEAIRRETLNRLAARVDSVRDAGVRLQSTLEADQRELQTQEERAAQLGDEINAINADRDRTIKEIIDSVTPKSDRGCCTIS